MWGNSKLAKIPTNPTTSPRFCALRNYLPTFSNALPLPLLKIKQELRTCAGGIPIHRVLFSQKCVFLLILLVVLHRQHFVRRWGKELTLPAFGLYRLDCALGESVGLMMDFNNGKRSKGVCTKIKIATFSKESTMVGSQHDVHSSGPRRETISRELPAHFIPLMWTNCQVVMP